MVPVMIITLCRYEHFRKCVESLANNELAKETDLYIGLDYPKTKEHESGYELISEYLSKGVLGFNSVNVVRHATNVGVSQNYQIVKNIIFEKYDRLIYSEDDNVFAPGYLTFMNSCMDCFANDDRVLSVCGYSYPVSFPNTNKLMYKCSYYTSAFGYGLFKNNIEKIENTISENVVEKMYFDKIKMRKLRQISPNQYVNFVKGMVGYTSDLYLRGCFRDSADLTWGLYSFFEGMYNIFPVQSFVRNEGYDGSGVNCDIQAGSKNSKWANSYRYYDFNSQPIDESYQNTDITDKDAAIEGYEVDMALSKFFMINKKELISSMLTYYFSCVFGIEKTRKLVARLKRK